MENDNITKKLSLDQSNENSKRLGEEEYHIDKSNKSSPTAFVDAGGCVASEVCIQHHSVAPTLPNHSPLSPLLTDATTYQHLKETQLSARYINNANFFYYTKKSSTCDFIRSDTESLSTIQTLGSKPVSSKLLCYCETTEPKSFEHSYNNKVFDSETTKRLVPTRNAATSPHLDVRKLGSMTTLIPSSLLTKELFSRSNYSKDNKFNIPNNSDIIFGDCESTKTALQKKKSIVGSNSVKTLRTTRSLSPRPPLKHQHAVLLPDSNQLKVELFGLPKTCTRGNRKQTKKLCRSEQSSPNITEGTEISFSYKDPTNRSISCLCNSFTGSSFKNLYSDSKIATPALTVKETIEKRSAEELKGKKDPWIKRADVDRNTKLSKYDLFHQDKSFSGSKFVFEPILGDSYGKNESKKISRNLGSETKLNLITEFENQSVPESPQFLTARNIVSPSYINGQGKVGHLFQKTPTRSCSFSPARIKDSVNPFIDRRSFLTNSTPPLISLHSEVKPVENIVDYDFLKVCSPNGLNSRHSFSSVSDKKGEELQLNIRRLSDQMLQKDSIFPNDLKVFSADRNVGENALYRKKVINSANDISNSKLLVEIPNNSADFSDYLEQFKYIEAKKRSLHKEKTYLENNKASINKAIAANKTTQKSSDFLLETTC